MEKWKQFEQGMVPHIPPKPDFADMKNKIFFKQHSHYQKQREEQDAKDKGNKRWRRMKEKKQGKRKDSPTLKEVVNPKDEKRTKLTLNEVDSDSPQNSKVDHGKADVNLKK